MATEFYKSSLITSTPKRDSRIGAWVPYAFISWHDQTGHFQIHRFPELDALSFATEQEAVSCGLSVAHRWMDTSICPSY
jgi:hypothetical protein